MSESTLTHLDESGHATMVDIGHKPVTSREARAEGFILMARTTLQAIADDALPKGEVLGVARVAGIMAAKKCAELIPLCHTLPLESVSVDFDVPAMGTDLAGPVKLHVTASARLAARTGVEMEALTAVSVAALTIYDMCKAIDKRMEIGGIRLVAKSGGKNDFSEAPRLLPPDNANILNER